MEYECRFAALTNMLISPLGSIDPLCTTCICSDCTNPIRKVKMSEFGISKEQRLYIMASMDYMAVIECNGYMPEDQPIEEE